ncbi:MAG TPA: flagellar biosynthetic protein FliO [Acetobacteraceae bacterium]|nr:flagellar biosynthetic protein FliO [Acetobacteraceae bacterium]
MLSSPASLLTAAAALAVVLALIWLAARAARLAGFASRTHGSARLLVVQDTLALDARRRLHLVRCGDRQVLLLTGAGQDLVVGWIGEPLPLVPQ